MYLIVGGNSEIGAATAGLLRRRGEPFAVTTRRASEAGQDRILLDFDTLAEDWVPPVGVRSACVFVAVARLAACEADPAGSSFVNCTQTLKLVRSLTRAGIYTLLLSTNQVFDGTQPDVSADAPLCPVSAYGRQKAEMETSLRELTAAGAPAGILRLAKVVSPGMALVANWRRELAAGRPVRAFHDMTMAPTPTAQVADAIVRMMADREPVTAQLTGPNDMAYLDVARLVATDVGASQELVEATSALDNGMPAGATPRHTTLDSSYLRDRYGIVVDSAEDVVRSIAGEAARAG